MIQIALLSHAHQASGFLGNPNMLHDAVPRAAGQPVRVRSSPSEHWQQAASGTLFRQSPPHLLRSRLTLLWYNANWPCLRAECSIPCPRRVRFGLQESTPTRQNRARIFVSCLRRDESASNCSRGVQAETFPNGITIEETDRNMRDFEYDAPTSLAEALATLDEHQQAARPLAGGTDLIDQVRTEQLNPDLIVDVKKIAELNRLEIANDGLRLGAAVPCYKIYGENSICANYSALTDACRIIGGIQIQSRASVGGNLCNSGPAADSTPALIALQATCLIAGLAGEREVPVEDFCTGPGQNVLEPGELLVELKFPARPPHSGSHYRRFIPRNEMDIAVVGVGASVVLDTSGENFVSARIALAAVAPTPLFAEEAGESLAGKPVNGKTISAAAEAARAIATPIDDMRGTAEFRLHLTGVLTERVLVEAVARARGSK